ncbi:MAG: hypothetical protein AB7E42_05005 [Anaerotignaceae bacterium]
MNIAINITHEDLMKNPNIIDGVKALGQMLAGEDKAIFTTAPIKEAQAITEAIEEPQEYIEDEGLEPPSMDSYEDEPAYTIEEVRKALGDLSKAKGTDAAKNILKSFKVSKVTELLQKDYPSVMGAVKAVK